MSNRWILRWSDGTDGHEMGTVWELELDLNDLDPAVADQNARLYIEHERIVSAALFDMETVQIVDSRPPKDSPT